MTKRFNLFKIILLLYGIIHSIAVQAHPHSFISLKTEFYVEQGLLTKLHFVWTMDELTSAYLMLESEQDDKVILNDLMNNISENHLFSEFWQKSSPKDKPIILIPLEQGADLNLDNPKAVISFWSKLKQPIVLTNQKLELMTYENTFYVDMYYESSHNIKINAPNCKINLENPTPDDFVQSYAKSLDQEDTPIEEDDFILGKLFAQKVVIACE